jgi:signal transduction histidine kinase
MTKYKEPTSSDFSAEHRKYLLGVSAFVSILAVIYVAIMAYFNAYDALMLNGVATAIIMATTFRMFQIGKIKTAEVLMSLGGSLVLGVYCYKSPEAANPSALMVLSALQSPLYMAHLNVFWNFLGIIAPILMFITLQQPGSHSPAISPLDVESQAMINSTMVSSCAVFIAMAGVFGMRRFIALRNEQREREAQMIQTSKLASLGEMAAGIAHEINNPITIIDGYAWKMLRSLENDSKIDRDDFYQSVKIMNDSTRRITSIVSGMRKFTREATNDPLVYSSIGSLIDDAIVLCNARVKKHEATLTISRSPLLDTDILTVPVQVTQILVNLLQNAADATSEIPEKNRRSIVVSCAEPDSKMITIKVIDSGKGIPEEIAQKIFEPFFTTKEAGHGTGLGLSISKGIIESLGGELTLGLEQGKTCFCVTIPRDSSNITTESKGQ